MFATRGRAIPWLALYQTGKWIYGHGRRAWGNLEPSERERLGALRAAFAGKGTLELRDWRRWKVRAGFPFREVIQGGRTSIPDFDERAHRSFKIVSLAP